MLFYANGDFAHGKQGYERAIATAARSSEHATASLARAYHARSAMRFAAPNREEIYREAIDTATKLKHVDALEVINRIRPNQAVNQNLRALSEKNRKPFIFDRARNLLIVE